jgi:hypothetical protein
MTADIHEQDLLDLERLLKDADDLPRLPAGLKRRTFARAARQRAADQWMQRLLSSTSALLLALGLLLSTVEPAANRWMADVPFPPDVIRTSAGERDSSSTRISPEMEWALVEDSNRLREYQRGVIHSIF